MSSFAFTTPLTLNTGKFRGESVLLDRHMTFGKFRVSAPKNYALVMSTADVYQAQCQTQDQKAKAASKGVYTVQFTEGSSSQATPFQYRSAALSAAFRARQTTASERYADLYATRRALLRGGVPHYAETAVVKFPIRAAAMALAESELKRTCSRYFPKEDEASEYIYRAKNLENKRLKATNGVYNVSCTEGNEKGQAEVARIAGLAREFRAAQYSISERAGQEFDTKLAGVRVAQTEYGEKMAGMFPKMAAETVTYGTGAYAAYMGGWSAAKASYEGGAGKLVPISERLKGENAASIWRSSPIRPAVEGKKRAWWNPSPLKNYAYMSEAAVAYGVAAQSKPFKESKYVDSWTPKWQPKSSVSYN